MTTPRTYIHLRGIPSRRVKTPHHAAHFRTVAGERLAEIQQVERLVKRAFVRESRIDIRRFSWIDRQPHDPTPANDERQQLLAQVSDLRRLLAKTRRPTTGDRPVPVPSLDAAAELLALLEPDEADCLLEVLIAGSSGLSSIVQSLGLERAMRISNMAGKSAVALADGDRMTATAFGRALGSWIVGMTANGPEVDAIAGACEA